MTGLAMAVLGLASACMYLWRRQWLDAVLVAVAAGALALMAAGFNWPAGGGSTLAIDPANPPATVGSASRLAVSGDGLRAAQWRDYPALPLAWTQGASDVLRLEFPRRLALGRMFTLAVRRKHAPGRLQLLAENGQVLAEARGDGDLSVQWLPPLAEALVLKARLLDGEGKLVAEGPIPVSVRDATPLGVRGRFGAPSFDLRVLDELLVKSNALVDWQVTLGKNLSRSETARAEQAAPNLLLVDAAWFERATAQQRAATLGQVAQGASLLVLGANANDAGLWARTVGLELKPQPANKRVGAPLDMTAAPLAPGALRSGQWTGDDGALWTRQWQGGRIGWLAAGDWHRHAISQPQALALWWQGVIDRLGVRYAQDVAWLDPEEMPLPGQRLELCAQGVRGTVSFGDEGPAQEWQRRPDKADASCVAVWPKKAGWLGMQAQDGNRSEVYVFAPGDWPMWQAAQRRDATARYAARTPVAAKVQPVPLPAWPFAVVFAVAMLGLWWRERR